ncbi:MAG: LPS export ABC transporter periplasmic protein LptC [Acidobacteria bacterium]|nr:LPS export ABC transporter periplasmic protein LptC [Acidobacteriota bacterium]
MFREKLPAIGRVLSLLLLIGTIAVIVMAFVRSRRQPRPPSPVRVVSALKPNVTSVVERYKYVKSEDGRETFRLLAAKDTTYEDGRHELEKIDLTAFDKKPNKSMRIIADHGTYLRDPGLVTFEGNVKVTSSEGLEVTTQLLKYEQVNEIASTEIAIQFRQGEISGSSIGAQLNAKARNLVLIKDARVISTNTELNNPNAGNKGGPPLEIRSERANYSEQDGMVRFEGNANAVHGERYAQADAITGMINPQTKKLDRIELRGNSFLKSDEVGKASEMKARDMDFFFDEAQRLKSAVGTGAAHARSLEKDSPREITAERIEATYKPSEKGSDLQSVVTQGRTTMKIEVAEGAPKAAEITERVIEADSVQASFREDGKNLARAEANGNAILTVTPKKITPASEKKNLRAAKFTAEFNETGNTLKTFLADGGAVAELEPMDKASKRTKKTLSGKKLTANFQEQTQDIGELFAEGDAKLIDGERHATAARATYNASTQIVAMRGRPLLWDSSARANADEIDANLDNGESLLRGHVRTTYYSRETTGRAVPFKDKKAPITIVADHAVVKHNEGAARYLGNVRAWQEDDFVRAENMELDKGERMMVAWGNAQSAFYDFEREVEKGRKETVPVFAQSNRITYRDETRTAYYEGAVKIRQGTDQIDAAVADAVMDEEHRLVRLTASKDVVMTQPSRRATGDQVVYTAATDTAVLTGNLAVVEENEREAVTKSAKLTMHLRDARIEANDESGKKRRVKTTHRIQK